MASRIAFTLQPPRPITRLITEEGTESFLDLGKREVETDIGTRKGKV